MIRLLNALPRLGAHPASAVKSLLDRDGGRKLSLRGVTKALKTIASEAHSPIEEIYEGNGIATRWKWRDKHPLRTLAFEDAELLHLTLLQQLAMRLLPPLVAGQLEHDAKWIASRLAEHPESQVSWWLKHVMYLPPGPPRYPAPLDENIVQEVSKALWNRRQLAVDYRSRGAKAAKSMVLHPQGLVMSGETLTLVAVVGDYTEARHFVIRRLESARMLPGDARSLPGFDFREHVAKEFGWPYGEPETIEFWLHEERLLDLAELPISPDQQIDPEADADGFHRVTATVVPNVRLDALLASFGEQLFWEEE